MRVLEVFGRTRPNFIARFAKRRQLQSQRVIKTVHVQRQQQVVQVDEFARLPSTYLCYANRFRDEFVQTSDQFLLDFSSVHPEDVRCSFAARASAFDPASCDDTLQALPDSAWLSPAKILFYPSVNSGRRTISPPFSADSWARMPTHVQLALVTALGQGSRF